MHTYLLQKKSNPISDVSWCPLTSVPHDAVWFITGKFWAEAQRMYENNGQKERFILNLDDQDIYIKLPAPKS